MTAIKFFNIFKIQILNSMRFPNAAFIFLLFFYACPSAFSQQKFSIHGTVNDKNSGEPLIGATMIVQRLNQGVITNDYVLLPEFAKRVLFNCDLLFRV